LLIISAGCLLNDVLLVLCGRAELLAQELKELQAELGDYNTVGLLAVLVPLAVISSTNSSVSILST